MQLQDESGHFCIVSPATIPIPAQQFFYLPYSFLCYGADDFLETVMLQVQPFPYHEPSYYTG